MAALGGARPSEERWKGTLPGSSERSLLVPDDFGQLVRRSFPLDSFDESRAPGPVPRVGESSD